MKILYNGLTWDSAIAAYIAGKLAEQGKLPMGCEGETPVFGRYPEVRRISAIGGGANTIILIDVIPEDLTALGAFNHVFGFFTRLEDLDAARAHVYPDVRSLYTVKTDRLAHDLAMHFRVALPRIAHDLAATNEPIFEALEAWALSHPISADRVPMLAAAWEANEPACIREGEAILRARKASQKASLEQLESAMFKGAEDELEDEEPLASVEFSGDPENPGDEISANQASLPGLEAKDEQERTL